MYVMKSMRTPPYIPRQEPSHMQFTKHAGDFFGVEALSLSLDVITEEPRPKYARITYKMPYFLRSRYIYILNWAESADRRHVSTTLPFLPP